MIFVDASGLPWEVIDLRLGPPPESRRIFVEIGDATATIRAFHRPEEIRAGRLEIDRGTSHATLARQFASAVAFEPHE